VVEMIDSVEELQAALREPRAFIQKQMEES
jgi:hypothetical protein